MPYGPEQGHRASYNASFQIVVGDGSAAMSVELDIESAPEGFEQYVDEAFQDVIDRLSASTYLSWHGASKTWRTSQEATLTA